MGNCLNTMFPFLFGESQESTYYPHIYSDNDSSNDDSNDGSSDDNPFGPAYKFNRNYTW